jgi:hypothetical protein
MLVGVLSILSACTSRPKTQVGVKDTTPTGERLLLEFAKKGEFGKAHRLADTLLLGRNPYDREIGTYWKLLLWVNEGEFESAVTLVEAGPLTWSSQVRKLHADALLQVLSAWKSTRNQGGQDGMRVVVRESKSLLSKVSALEQKNSELEREVQRLDGLRKRYEALMQELETIH